MDAYEKRMVEGELRATVEKRVEELETAKEAIELRILGHYPEKIVRDVREKPGRTAYAADIYMWMAISLFRQWFAQAIGEGRTRLGEDGGWRFYRLLAEGGDAYLNKEDLREFHQYFPMSSKASGVLEMSLGQLKDDAKEFVEGLMVNKSHLPVGAVEWLTCADIRKADLPWEAEKEGSLGTERDDLGELLDANVEIDEDSDVDMIEDGGAHLAEAGTKEAGLKDELGGVVGEESGKGKGKAQTSIADWVERSSSVAGPAADLVEGMVDARAVVDVEDH